MIESFINKVFNGNSYDILKSFPDKIVDSCVTSPPYYSLRDYGTDHISWPTVKYSLFGKIIRVPKMKCSLGLEPTPEYFIGHLVLLFREVGRVLKDDGTLWLNIGDSYWGGKGKSGQSYSNKYQNERYNAGRTLNPIYSQLGGEKKMRPSDGKHKELKPKDLIGIPWMLAFALRSDGWYLRQDIIWNKPNPMPESVTDRCTKAHEYIFLLSKNPRYYYDYESIMTKMPTGSLERINQDIDNQNGSCRVPGKINGNMKALQSWKGSSFNKGKTGEMKDTYGHTRKSGNKERKQAIDRGVPENTGSNVCSHVPWEGEFANKRSVWNVATSSYKDAHFATFPEALIKDAILAGCPPGGIVLDPFMGAHTTAITASKLGRNYLGIELNEKYMKIGEKRIHNELGLFK